VNKAVDFRDHVADCLRMAEQAKTRTHKALLLDLAQAWVLLAEQARHVAGSPGLGSPEAAQLSH
jgi:hypothetical protein